MPPKMSKASAAKVSYKPTFRLLRPATDLCSYVTVNVNPLIVKCRALALNTARLALKLVTLGERNSRSQMLAFMLQEAKEKEKKQKAEALAGGGVSLDELTLKVQTLEAEKKGEEELRNYMQLERVRHHHITIISPGLK